MKKSLVLITLMILSSSMLAQESCNAFRTKNQLTIEPFISMGMLDLSEMTRLHLPYYSALGTSVFYQATDKVRVGLGAEFALSDGEHTNYNYPKSGRYVGFVPVFFNFKYNFWNNSNVSPFFDCRMGYAFSAFPKDLSVNYEDSWTTGSMEIHSPYLNFGMGLSWRRSEFMAGVSMATYTAQTCHYYPEDSFGHQINEEDYVGGMYNFYLRYGYRFGLNHRQPKPVVCMDNAGQKSLSIYGQVGLFDYAVVLSHLLQGGGIWVYHAAFGAVFEYHVTDGFSVGFGTELHSSQGKNSGLMRMPDKMMLTLPLYGDARMYFGHDEARPFVEARLGYAFPLNTVNVAEGVEWYGDYRFEPAPIVWQGPLQGQGLYSGFGMGVNMNHHEIMVGHTSYHYGGLLTYLPDGHKEWEKSIMNNVYLRYSYRLNW